MKTSYRSVTLLGGYFKEKEVLNRAVTLGAVYDRFDESGRIRAFSCDWKEGMPDRPHFFWDSDVAKWMEGAAYVLAKEESADLQDKVEHLIDAIEANQGEDGYFNIYFTVCEPDKRFTNRDWHELYCAGHLMEAAVAYYEATGRDRFLRIMEKYADYIEKVFIIDKSASYETPGHEEIEMALYRMYTATGKEKYLDMMTHFLERRGQENNHTAPEALRLLLLSAQYRKTLSLAWRIYLRLRRGARYRLCQSVCRKYLRRRQAPREGNDGVS